jgi:hypothetical protein
MKRQLCVICDDYAMFTTKYDFRLGRKKFIEVGFNSSFADDVFSPWGFCVVVAWHAELKMGLGE